MAGLSQLILFPENIFTVKSFLWPVTPKRSRVQYFHCQKSFPFHAQLTWCRAYVCHFRRRSRKMIGGYDLLTYNSLQK